ncbi:MAG TPA: hypothetical protein VKY45_13185, partial [Marinilabiliaceae bacterium]|nr:hypothetical protein [Marinilabiliaceae bacterium]
ADEPTGALDSQTSLEVMEILSDVNKSGISIIIVTHEREVAARTQRIIRLRDGLVVDPNLESNDGIWPELKTAEENAPIHQ